MSLKISIKYKVLSIKQTARLSENKERTLNFGMFNIQRMFNIPTQNQTQTPNVFVFSVLRWVVDKYYFFIYGLWYNQTEKKLWNIFLKIHFFMSV